MFINLSASAFIVIVYGVYATLSSSERDTYSELHRVRRVTHCLNKFRCSDGQCIDTYDKCDGKRDCIDGSDETDTVCKDITCPLKSFQCSYGACVDEKQKCDGKSDCGDGSDEENCEKPIDRFSNTISSCRDVEFKCKSNEQCINNYDICDGTQNCPDGSDETRDLCLNVVCPQRSFKCTYNGACLDPSLVCNGNKDCLDGSDEQQGCPPTRCRPGSFKCTYNGGCLDLSLRCNGREECPDASDEQGCSPQTTRPPNRVPFTPTRGTTTPIPLVVTRPNGISCKLPNPPKDGSFLSVECGFNDARPECRNTPGTVVPPNWILKYTCNSGYSLNKDSEYSICDNGVWQNQGECVKLCKPLESLSVRVTCYFESREVPCERPMKPDTTATAQCKRYYVPAYLPEYSKLVCLKDGEWSYPLFHCREECGLSSKTEIKYPVPLIDNGHKTTLGEFPWLAAIYRGIGKDKWDQMCGGTLITTHIVITAAHCLVNEFRDKLQPNEIRVGLGKYKRSFYEFEATSITSEIKEVIIHDKYVGEQSQYAADIGLLDLVVKVQVTDHIMPACFDWSVSLTPGANDEGVVAGWGKTEDGSSSEIALSARLKFITYNQCVTKLRAGLKQFLTIDKFCAGVIDGSQVNHGDSGGGLTFVKDRKHFLFGVVSTKIPDEPSLSLFINIQEYSGWLEREKNKLMRSHVET